ncbi:MAG: hypothetical protein VKJ24_10605 [Synechococcales bacterium]|nr:hypothetical protein [Synechococcales bacterium]
MTGHEQGAQAIGWDRQAIARQTTLPGLSRRKGTRFRQGLVGILCSSWLGSSGLVGTAIAQSGRFTCPQDITTLTQLLVRDLPSYANRLTVRNKRLSQLANLPTVILASQPDLQPLPLIPGGAIPSDPTLQQVFITTLERQTTAQQVHQLQQYHWLFLVQTRRGWQLTQSYSRTGSYPAGKTITPPRESSQSTIAQSIKLWLRDCQAGAVRPSHEIPSGQ